MSSVLTLRRVGLEEEEEEGSGRPKNKIFAGTLNPLSGAGKEVIGSNHKSINRMPRVSKGRPPNKKTGKCGNFSQVGDPPPSPLFGNDTFV